MHMSNYDRWITSTPADWDDEPEPRYEVREAAEMGDPVYRGAVIGSYATYREAFRRWQELDASGRSVYVIRVSE